jgi:hypothetical protein
LNLLKLIDKKNEIKKKNIGIYFEMKNLKFTVINFVFTKKIIFIT